MNNDKYLKYRDWVEYNREYVHNQSKGKIGYIHIPDMGVPGYSEFHRYFLTEISYDGLGYSGWQIQPKEKTIQGELQDALSTLMGSNIKLTGAGRTDTGVHAIKSFAHFDFKQEIDYETIKLYSGRSTVANLSGIPLILLSHAPLA